MAEQSLPVVRSRDSIVEEAILEEAKETSREVVNNYLLYETADLHIPHAPLIDYHRSTSVHKKKKKKEKKHKKEKKKKRERKSASSDGVTTGFPESPASSSPSLPSLTGNPRCDTSTTTSSSCLSHDELDREPDHPVSFLLEKLRNVAPPDKFPRTYPCLSMTGVFAEWTDEQKASYDKDAITAIRSRDLDTLRRWHRDGRTLQAANAFGESLLHMACRRGFLEVVQYLVNDAKHDIWIRDDTGRTPLHDACWTTKPNAELVEFLVRLDPDMLLVADKRGHTPLDYARRDHFPYWVDYFEKQDFAKLLPRRDYFYTNKPATVEQEDVNSTDNQGLIVDNLDAMISQFGEQNLRANETDSEEGSFAGRYSGRTLIVHFGERE